MPRSGRPSTSLTKVNIAKVMEMVKEMVIGVIGARMHFRKNDNNCIFIRSHVSSLPEFALLFATYFTLVEGRDSN